ncbi:MAG: hypothetical protein HY262_10195, partial [Chloroflexi bacterium]|nr:hypothetical protein [Chloroflexota bacterium]
MTTFDAGSNAGRLPDPAPDAGRQPADRAKGARPPAGPRPGATTRPGARPALAPSTTDQLEQLRFLHEVARLATTARTWDELLETVVDRTRD